MKSIEGSCTLLISSHYWWSGRTFLSLSYQLLCDTANVQTASEINLTAVTISTLTQVGTYNLGSHTE